MSFWSRIFRLLPNKVEDEQLTNLTQVAFGLNVETLESEKTTPEAKQDAKAYLDRFWETDSAGRNQGEPDWMVAMNAKSERLEEGSPERCLSQRQPSGQILGWGTPAKALFWVVTQSGGLLWSALYHLPAGWHRRWTMDDVPPSRR